MLIFDQPKMSDLSDSSAYPLAHWCTTSACAPAIIASEELGVQFSLICLEISLLCRIIRAIDAPYALRGIIFAETVVSDFLSF